MTVEIRLPAKMDHVANSKLLNDLRSNIDQPLMIDCSDVKGVGGLAAQTLLAAVQEWRSKDIALEIVSSEAMRSDLERLGLRNEILIQDDTQ